MDNSEWAIGDDLPAGGPHPDGAAALDTFGQFVGSWNVRMRFFDADRDPSPLIPARWSFAWILDGRAIQDVLVMPAGPGRSLRPGERGIGTTLRYRDPATSMWHVVFIGATSGNYVTLTARAEGADIVLDGRDADGTPLRWSFTEVTPTTFHWLGHVSDDGGATWRLEQEMHAQRATTTAAVPSDG